MQQIINNDKRIHENMIKLVDALYYFCHANFMPEPGEKNGRLFKYPFFPALMTAIGELMLDESYNPPIFEVDEEIKNKFYWLHKNCDWIVKNPETPYFFRCHLYRAPKKTNSCDPELKAPSLDEEKWDQLLELIREKLESDKRRK